MFDMVASFAQTLCQEEEAGFNVFKYDKIGWEMGIEHRDSTISLVVRRK